MGHGYRSNVLRHAAREHPRAAQQRGAQRQLRARRF